MARVPQVTRTIKTTVATVLCMNLETNDPFETQIVLPRTYKTDKLLLKKAGKMLDSSTVKAIHIKSSTVEKDLYGMSEEKFVKLADKMTERK